MIALLVVTAWSIAPVVAASPLTQVDTLDRFEPNDDFATATPLPPGTYPGLDIDQGDLDVFAVDLQTTSTLSAAIRFSQAAGDLDMYLFAPDQATVLQVSNGQTDGEEISYVAPQAGTYYLLVVGFQGATGTYDLTLTTSGTSTPGTTTPGTTTPETTTPETTTPGTTTPGTTPPTQSGESEPNDGYANATRVQAGTYTGLQITANDVDVYAIDLQQASSLAVSIQFAQAEGDLDLFLVGPDQSTVLQASTTQTDGENVSTIATEAGTYYLVVVGFQNATAAYEMTVSTTGDGPVTPPPSGELEPNDDFANATSVQPGTYSGLQITANDVDVYAVDLTAGDGLSATIRFAQTASDLDLFLVAPDQATVLQASTSETDGENVSTIATEAGTHYLVVVGFQNATGAYDLVVDVSGDSARPVDPSGELEPNDDFANATIVDAGSYPGLELTANDIDVYAVDLAGGETLTAAIAFAQAEGDLDLFLVAPDQASVLQASTTQTDGEDVTYLASDAGTYYLVVVGFQNATAGYELTITRSGATNGSDGPVLPGTDAPGDGTDQQPVNDRIGWENGVWANATVAIDQTDGLSEDERSLLLARGMARVEAIRGLEFQRNVTFDVMTREAFADFLNETNATQAQLDLQATYYNQVYEATFIVDEPTNAYDVVVGGTAAAVAGFYLPGTDTFYLITPTPDAPTVDESVLIHELVHALQDQYSLLQFPPSVSADESRARLGLTEGEANYVEYLYEARCGVDWECLATPNQTGSNGSDLNLGVFLVQFVPYSDGPVLVHSLYERGGWDAVMQAYQSPPYSTEQVIHPEDYPNESLVDLPPRGSSSGNWTLFTTERVGEAWMYAMFWYQGYQYGNPVIDGSAFVNPDGGEYDTYNYTSVPSAGWGNDRLDVYTNGDQAGYVWTTTWDTEADAVQFEAAYVAVLQGQSAQQIDANTWVIPEGSPFADAFYVVRTGTTVTIVNAPTQAALGEIAPTLVGAPALLAASLHVNESPVLVAA